MEIVLKTKIFHLSSNLCVSICFGGEHGYPEGVWLPIKNALHMNFETSLATSIQKNIAQTKVAEAK